MKIDLTEEATKSIEALREKLTASNAAINARYSAIVSAVMIEFVKTVQDRDMTSLVSRLMTHAGRRKQLIQSLLELDEDALMKLEISVKKFRQTNSKSDENTGKNAHIFQKLN